MPLYYTGLTSKAVVQQGGGVGSGAQNMSTSASSSYEYTLARDYSITIAVEMEPMSIAWFVIS